MSSFSFLFSLELSFLFLFAFFFFKQALIVCEPLRSQWEQLSFVFGTLHEADMCPVFPHALHDLFCAAFAHFFDV